MSYDIGGVPGAQPVAGAASRALFARVMGLVAVTCGFAALGAYAGRDLNGLWWLLPWLGALACIIGLNYAAQRAPGLAIALLFGVGFLLGLSIGVTIAYYAETAPAAVYQAAGATR